jgi:hypothetical protein
MTKRRIEQNKMTSNSPVESAISSNIVHQSGTVHEKQIKQVPWTKMAGNARYLVDNNIPVWTI